MAIYGIGASYSGKFDKTNAFIENNCACIGWSVNDAPALHQILKKIKIGDFIYIKTMSITTKELHIKAVGIVMDDSIEEKSDLGLGITVKWLWKNEEKVRVSLTEEMYKYNVYNNTLYEEYFHIVQRKVLELALKNNS